VPFSAYNTGGGELLLGTLSALWWGVDSTQKEVNAVVDGEFLS
jgi:hypothetical protein